MWIKTDDLQYVRKVKDGIYDVAEARHAEGAYFLCEGAVDLKDWKDKDGNCDSGKSRPLFPQTSLLNEEFTIYSKERPVAKVVIKEGRLLFVERYTESPFYQVLPKNANIFDIYTFLKSRCYEDGRADLKQILEAAGMTENNPWEWCRKTHGVNYSDFTWIKWVEEEITWDEVKLHD